MVLGKHFISDVASPVEKALKALLETNPTLGLIESHKIVYRRSTKPVDKVVLISGGGSGHEPAHASYIGSGALDVAVAGDIFASPSAAQILVGLKAIETNKGILMIVKNYTGDKLNFGLAAQKARAEGQNISVVFVNEDASLNGKGLVGRRGLAGTVFVHKIAGAAAERGLSLADVTAVAQQVADNVMTVGVSLDKCSVPGRTDQEALPSNELEYGMGIHNEPGVKRSTIANLPTIVSNILTYFFAKSAPVFIGNDDPIAVMVNNLGGLSVLELNVIAEEVISRLSRTQSRIVRKFVGTFMTSLDGPGFSVTILRLSAQSLSLLDDPTDAPAWPKQITSTDELSAAARTTQYTPPAKQSITANPSLTISPEILSKLPSALLQKITAAEPTITRYDTIVGDGDCGTTLLKGVQAINTAFSENKIDTTDLSSIFENIAEIVEKTMGGTSGAIYGIFLNAFVNNLRKTEKSQLKEIIQGALQGALDELCTFTPARKGHRTLMDTLIPFVETFGQSGDLAAAVAAGKAGAEETRKMEAKLGRASYVSADQVERDGGIMDPGAMGLSCVLEVFAEQL